MLQFGSAIWLHLRAITWRLCATIDGDSTAIRINDQWRICFIWREGDAYNVEITDYH
jgi:plasmid maintenance system killer protein